MRKLKFRCFDIEKKIMIEDCSHIQRDGLDVMQFTGLLDRRGKEIYEGDIVLLFWRFKNVVTYELGAFGYTGDIFGDHISFCQNQHFVFNGVKSDLIEVIGNIYEHPDLLK